MRWEQGKRIPFLLLTTPQQPKQEENWSHYLQDHSHSGDTLRPAWRTVSPGGVWLHVCTCVCLEGVTEVGGGGWGSRDKDSWEWREELGHRQKQNKPVRDHPRLCSGRGPGGILRPDELLEVDVLQVRGAAIPAVWPPGAQQVRQAGTGVVLAFPEEGDLRREEKRDDTFWHQPRSAQHGPVSPHPTPAQQEQLF